MTLINSNHLTRRKEGRRVFAPVNSALCRAPRSERGGNLTATRRRLLTLARWGRVKLENRTISEISWGSRIYRSTYVYPRSGFLSLKDDYIHTWIAAFGFYRGLRTDPWRVLKDSSSFRQQVFNMLHFSHFRKDQRSLQHEDIHT